MIERFPRTLSPWYVRLLLAALLLVGSEILLWIDPPGRTPGDWLLLAVGYIALAAVLLDVAARYRIRDVYDAMTLAAIYGLLNGLLLNPATALEVLPDTVVNRVLGGHTLLGLEMFGLFLALTDGRNRRYRRLLLAASLWVGFYWGVWTRWLPTFTQFGGSGITLGMLLTYGGAGLAAILIVFVVASRRTGDAMPPDLRLTVVEWGATLVVLLVFFLLRVSQKLITSSGLALIGALVAGCMAVLWFRRSERGATLLDGHVPPTPLSWRWIIMALVIFAVSAVSAYHLPLVTLFGIDQFRLMSLGFAGVGVAWLPFIASVLGVRALDRYSRTSKL